MLKYLLTVVFVPVLSEDIKNRFCTTYLHCTEYGVVLSVSARSLNLCNVAPGL